MLKQMKYDKLLKYLAYNIANITII